MKTTIEINRPYVHGSVSISWIGDEVLNRLHVCSDALSVNVVPVLVDGVLTRSGNAGRFESFALAASGNGRAKQQPRRLENLAPQPRESQRGDSQCGERVWWATARSVYLSGALLAHRRDSP
jgi:hypothetical protein